MTTCAASEFCDRFPATFSWARTERSTICWRNIRSWPRARRIRLSIRQATGPTSTTWRNRSRASWRIRKKLLHSKGHVGGREHLPVVGGGAQHVGSRSAEGGLGRERDGLAVNHRARIRGEGNFAGSAIYRPLDLHSTRSARLRIAIRIGGRAAVGLG